MSGPRGKALLDDPRRTKSTAFSRGERERLGLRGLLPYDVCDISTQQQRVLGNLRRKNHAIEKYIFLTQLQERNERLFYRTLIDHVAELMPLVYTPTVGQAAQEFAHIFRREQGLYVTPEDRGEVREVLANWPAPDVRAVVVTDGERILGLGDLGANGMAIAIGKLALYTACGGIDPAYCLPVTLDVGTDNAELRDDPLYLGYPHPRLRGEAYLALVDEFVAAVAERFPGALIQFEDFATANAFRLLDRYRDRYRCFNDDVQGTAAVALAGVEAAERITGKSLADQRYLFLGAGSAATGIADLLVRALVAGGCDEAGARSRIALVDRDGLVAESRDDLDERLRRYALPGAVLDFHEALEAHEPDVLIGATGAPGTFDETAIRTMARLNERPVIFALSNPTSRAECRPEQAYAWSDDRAVYASGSPFEPVERGERTLEPAQSNNVYVFPGLALGVLASGARHVSENLFLTAARALAETPADAELERGTLYPPFDRLREVSAHLACRVAEAAWAEGLAEGEPPADLPGRVDALMYDPWY